MKLLNKITNRFIDLDLMNKSTIMISGMGRSGTTWLADLINHNLKYRDIFEPFYPYKVEIAKYFKYLQYLNPGDTDTYLINSAKKILSGKFRSKWSDVNSNNLIYTKRIVKDIRTNLMLGWLKTLRPSLPLILIIRNPYSVIDSYKSLGWGIEAGGGISDYHRIVEQDNLLKDFPMVNEIQKSIDSDEYINRLIFQWCVMYYIPMQQLKESDYLLINYENLLLQPENTLHKIFSYLDVKPDIPLILNKIDKPSVTNYRNINFIEDKSQLVEKWKKSLSTQEIKLINEMINNFKLDYLYNRDGYPIE